MSEIKKRRKYINIGSFKLNRISLLNQSNLNASFEKLNIPKSKLMNNTTMPFNIFFNPIQNINSNSKNKENNKINPLTEKNKIIRKHNILQKIDFNINMIRNSNKKENEKKPINLKNNISDNINDKLSLHINKINSNFSNFKNNCKKKTNNSNNINDFNFNKTLYLNLPFLTQINENLNKNNSKSDLYHNINLHKHIDTSFLFNNLINENFISPSHKSFINLKKYKKIFTNDKIKKTCFQNLKKLKANYTEHSLIKKCNNSINEDNKRDKERNKDNNINLNNKNYELKISDTNNNENNKTDVYDNSNEDSKDNICDMNEIEKIISKSCYNIYSLNNSNQTSNNYNTNYILDKSGKDLKNKKYIFLNSLYKMKNDKISDSHFFESNKTSFNNYINMKNKNSIKRNKISRGTNTENGLGFLTNKITLNIFNQTYFGNDDNLYIRKNNKNRNKKNSMPYNFKKKIIKNNRTFNYLISVTNLSNKNFIRKIEH